MKTRPTVFSGESVRAIQALLKTQTRRVIIPQPWRDDLPDVPDAWVWSPQKRAAGLTYAEKAREDCRHTAWAGSVKNPTIPKGSSPYTPGDRLWVKETWRQRGEGGNLNGTDEYVVVEYRASSVDKPVRDGIVTEFAEERKRPPIIDHSKSGLEWRSPRFMPRWASRLRLEVESVRAERLQGITARDCLAEGIRGPLPPFNEESRTDIERIVNEFAGILRWGFMVSWDALNAKRGFGWFMNPWVWVVAFTLLKGE